jgi:hypothetical protein
VRPGLIFTRQGRPKSGLVSRVPPKAKDRRQTAGRWSTRRIGRLISGWSAAMVSGGDFGFAERKSCACSILSTRGVSHPAPFVIGE